MFWVDTNKYMGPIEDTFPFENYSPTIVVLWLLTVIELWIAQEKINASNYRCWFNTNQQVLDVLCRLPCKWHEWAIYLKTN